MEYLITSIISSYLLLMTVNPIEKVVKPNQSLLPVLNYQHVNNALVQPWDASLFKKKKTLENRQNKYEYGSIDSDNKVIFGAVSIPFFT